MITSASFLRLRQRLVPSAAATSELASVAGFGMLALLICWRSGQYEAAVALIYLAVVTPALVRWDLSAHRLPNSLIVPGLIILGVTLALWPGLAPSALHALFGGMTVSLAAHLVLGVGMGDVKLVTLLCGLAGTFDTGTAAFALVLGLVLAGVLSTLAVLCGRVSATASVPMGPPLLLGFWLTVVLYGQNPSNMP